MNTKTLKINEIFYSVQGESSYVGLPCVFVRLTYCNLRCSYCDTEYAFYDGKEMTIEEIISEINKYKCELIEITGGEPLLQANVNLLMDELIRLNKKVLLETSGSISIEKVNPSVHIVMDIKTPSSRMSNKNLFSNFDFLKPSDEVKFVISDKDDYNYSLDVIKKYNLENRAKILMGCVFNKLHPKELVEWILNDNLNVRFQLQIHKYIWDPETKGV